MYMYEYLPNNNNNNNNMSYFPTLPFLTCLAGWYVVLTMTTCTLIKPYRGGWFRPQPATLPGRSFRGPATHGGDDEQPWYGLVPRSALLGIRVSRSRFTWPWSRLPPCGGRA